MLLKHADYLQFYKRFTNVQHRDHRDRFRPVPFAPAMVDLMGKYPKKTGSIGIFVCNANGDFSLAPIALEWPLFGRRNL